MDEQRVPFNREMGARFARAIQRFTTSEVGGRALALFALLIALLLAINALNVVNSYVGRDFMTAIEARDRSSFQAQGALYVAVFAFSTAVSVLLRFAEERLGLLWREWLTRRVLRGYLAQRVYLRLAAAEGLTNPDQRIAEDIRTFAATTLSFLLLLLNGTLTVAAFSGVLWSISPLLFGVAVAYAALGSLLTIVLGRPLIWLDYSQLDREAEFRADLIHLRENAESIALLHREGRLRERLVKRLEALVANARRAIGVRRNLNFFTTGYNYMIQILPALLVAPLYFQGEVEFGVITQAAMAFSQLLGAFSLIITQFQSISSYAAVLSRVSSLADRIDGTRGAAPAPIEVLESRSRVAYEALTLRAPDDARVLVERLTLEAPHGTDLLILDAGTAASAALFRATAGAWPAGEGRIHRPGADQIFFLPERPYLPPGSLREVLAGFFEERLASEEAMLGALRSVGLQSVPERAGGFDVERDWSATLSLGEQQLAAVARLLLAAPRFAFLERLGSALPVEQERLVLGALAGRAISVVAVGESDAALDLYDTVLRIQADGSWSVEPVRAGRSGSPRAI